MRASRCRSPTSTSRAKGGGGGAARAPEEEENPPALERRGRDLRACRGPARARVGLARPPSLVGRAELEPAAKCDRLVFGTRARPTTAEEVSGPSGGRIFFIFVFKKN